MKDKLATLAVIISSLVTINIASAHESSCNVSLNHDISLRNNALTVSNNGKVQYQIKNHNLFIDGKKITLNSAQEKLLTQYETAVKEQIPEVVELVTDAVDLAQDAVGTAMKPLLGEATAKKVDQLMSKLSDKIASVAHKNENGYFLGSTEQAFDKAFDQHFEQEMENVIQNSLGSIMINVGNILMSSEGGSFTEKMASFERKIESMAEQIEQNIEGRADQFEQKAQLMCQDFKSIAELETKVRAAIPQLSKISASISTSKS
ncbi:MAG: YggN family protein [Parashewanella sp.]